jgi:hypothetical protein
LTERSPSSKNKNEKNKEEKNFSLPCRNRYVVLTNADSNSPETKKIVDKKSRSNCFQSKNQSSVRALNPTAEISQERVKIIAAVRRALKRKKHFKSSSRAIGETSGQLRLENLADSEDLASRD